MAAMQLGEVIVRELDTASIVTAHSIQHISLLSLHLYCRRFKAEIVCKKTGESASQKSQSLRRTI